VAREDRSGEVGLRRKAATLASIIALVALIVGALFGDRGLLHLIDQRHRAEALAPGDPRIVRRGGCDDCGMTFVTDAAKDG